jgi:DNA repair ATPase RecN
MEDKRMTEERLAELQQLAAKYYNTADDVDELIKEVRRCWKKIEELKARPHPEGYDHHKGTYECIYNDCDCAAP